MEKIREAALDLFSRRGYRATTMRDIAARAGVSTGNVYHHFGSKEVLFTGLVERYWERLRDPELPLNKVFAATNFPDDLEDLAEQIEAVIDDNVPYIMLIYVDVIEFSGKHIREFYDGMYERFSKAYGPSLERQRLQGRFGDVNPLMGVMVAVRWFFYYFTIEKVFNVPLHLGFRPKQAVEEFIKLLRYGLMARDNPTP